MNPLATIQDIDQANNWAYLPTVDFLSKIRWDHVSFMDIEDSIGELGGNLKDEIIFSIIMDDGISMKRKMMFFQALHLWWKGAFNQDEIAWINLLIWFYTRLATQSNGTAWEDQEINRQTRFATQWLLYSKPSRLVPVSKMNQILIRPPFKLPDSMIRRILDETYIV